MKKTLWAMLVTLLLIFATNVYSQDSINVASVVNSPDFRSWPQTAQISSVTFTDHSFPVEFNRREGPNRWPDQTTPGWSGPLQYTLGMCLNRGGWVCSGVVEFWYGRDLNATAPPNQIALEWFYDPRWGPLYHQQPALNEQVGIFVTSGDTRNDNVPEGIKERSSIVLVNWGSNFTAGATPPPPVVVPPPDENLSMRVERLDSEVGVLTVTLDEMRKAFINLRDVYDQMRTALSGIAAQAAAAEASTQRIDSYLTAKPIPVDCNANVFGLPVSCTLEFNR